MKSQILDFEKPLVELEQKLEELKRHLHGKDIDLDPEVRMIQEKIEETRKETYANLTAWQRVQMARHTARPFFLDYVELAFTDFVELKGDRLFGDDASMPAGLAKIEGIKCLLIGQQKGRDVKENLLRNFGSPHPEGYRKALRLMRLGEKFKLPIVTLIDTPGAYPGNWRGGAAYCGVDRRKSSRDDDLKNSRSWRWSSEREARAEHSESASPTAS